jgi:LysR family transcriptional regulator of beta-lactamase
MFEHDLSTDRLVRPFEAEARTGRYWLTRLRSRAETSAMQTFRRWLVDAVRDWAPNDCGSGKA